MLFVLSKIVGIIFSYTVHIFPTSILGFYRMHQTNKSNIIHNGNRLTLLLSSLLSLNVQVYLLCSRIVYFSLAYPFSALFNSFEILSARSYLSRHQQNYSSLYTQYTSPCVSVSGGKRG